VKLVLFKNSFYARGEFYQSKSVRLNIACKWWGRIRQTHDLYSNIYTCAVDQS
jgi:hypothetical protein